MTDDPAAAAAAAAEAAKTYDPAPFYATLDGDDKAFVEKKGLLKPGEDGKLPHPVVLARGWANAEKLIGEARLPDPRMDDPAELAKWPGWEKLGVPKEAKDYKFERPQMPEGVTYDEAAETRFRDMARKANMPQFMFQQIMNDEIASRTAAGVQAANDIKAQKTEIETALRKDYGAGYDAVITQAGQAVNYIAEQAGIDAGKTADWSSAILGSAETAKLFIWLGKAIGEGTLKGAENKGFTPSVTDAKVEIERLKTDAPFQAAYLDKTHAGHKDAVARMERLNKTISG